MWPFRNRRQFNHHQPHPNDDRYRLTWDCNSDTGQCGFVVLVNATERRYLLENRFVYQNEIPADEPHQFGFVGDLHPDPAIATGYEVVHKLEKFRQAQKWPNNMGPAY